MQSEFNTFNNSFLHLTLLMVFPYSLKLAWFISCIILFYFVLDVLIRVYTPRVYLIEVKVKLAFTRFLCEPIAIL